MWRFGGLDNCIGNRRKSGGNPGRTDVSHGKLRCYNRIASIHPRKFNNLEMKRSEKLYQSTSQ